MNEQEPRDSPDTRRETILSQLNRNERMSVGELSQLLGVSEVTIRKDLDALEKLGLLTRVHGGAVVSGRGRLESHFTARVQQGFEEKRRIAEAAATFIQPHQTIFLDASTSAFQLARVIKDREDLVVVTNGLYTALELNFSLGITTVVVGGRMRRRSSSLVGANADLIDRLRIDIGFFGAYGVTAADGLMEADLDEAALKQRMVAASSMVVGLADARKFGVRQLSVFALPHEIDRIITDRAAPPEIVAALRNQHLLVDLV